MIFLVFLPHVIVYLRDVTNLFIFEKCNSYPEFYDRIPYSKFSGKGFPHIYLFIYLFSLQIAVVMQINSFYRECGVSEVETVSSTDGRMREWHSTASHIRRTLPVSYHLITVGDRFAYSQF